MKIVKKLWNNLIFRHLLIIGGIFFSFLVLDVLLRYFSNNYVGFFGWARSAPNLFTFSDLFLAGEGADYFQFAIGKTSIKILMVLFISLLAMGVTLFLMKKTEEIRRDKYYYISLVLTTLVLVGGCRGLAIYKLGKQSSTTTWEAAFNAKNIYIDYNNQNKSLEVSGIYELVFRSGYLYIKDNYFSNKKELVKEVDEVLKDRSSELVKNKYTGVLEGKNVIYVLMESIDSWLVTEDVMPTLYKLTKEGLNFTERYSPAFGGGQTINSEFAMNTGLYAISNGKAIYNYDKNDYSNSIANMLKNNGYSAISIHTNSGGFYNRTNLHEALGYDTHYGLDNVYDINHEDYNYYNDTSLVKNDETYKMIVREEPFFSFVISYSAHIPYDETNDRCIVNPYGLNVKDNNELSCIRNLAKETDEMLRILIEKLEKDGLLDETVLVLATDHYTYGYGDQDYIKEYKNTDNSYLLQKVPLVIWNKDLKHKNVDTIMDTADILPTLLNMLGIEYNPNYYSGTDVFSDSHENFVYFSTDIFYDGELFYDGTTRYEGKEEYINNILSNINTKIKLNNNLIISDYFRNKE